MRTWTCSVVMATLLVSQARAEQAIQLERSVEMRLGGQVGERSDLTTTIAPSGSRQEHGNTVSIVGADGVTTLLRLAEKTRATFTVADFDMLRGFGSGMVTGLTKRVGGEGVASMPLQAAAKPEKVGPWQATVHAATKGGATIRVACAEGIVPTDLRERAMRAEFETGDLMALVPIATLLALPGYPVRVELALKDGKDEMTIRQTLRQAKAVQPKADWLAVPAGFASVEGPAAGMKRAVASLDDAIEAALPPPTSLHEAAKRGDVAAMTKFLDGGARLDELDAEGHLPLHAAANAGETEATRLLLARGAAIDARNTNDDTALLVATQRGHAETVGALADAGADLTVKTRRGNTPLTLAENRGHPGVVEVLRRRGAPESVRDLSWAAMNGRIDVMEELLAKGEDPSIRRGSVTPLILAIQMGEEEAAKWLLAHGAKHDTPDDYGFLPIHHAGAYGRKGTFAALVAAGAARDQGNAFGTRPLHLAAQVGLPASAEWLIAEQGASVTATNTDGWTPAHVAAWAGNAAVLKVLLDKGAARDAKDKKGRTPADLAREQSRASTLALLAP